MCSLRLGTLAAKRGMAPACLAEPAGWLTPAGGRGPVGWPALHDWRQRLCHGSAGVPSSHLSLHAAAHLQWLPKLSLDADVCASALELVVGDLGAGAEPEVLGATLELMLDHHVVPALVDSAVVARGDRRRLVARAELRRRDRVLSEVPAGGLTLSRWRGTRKGLGAYYSPRPLVRHLVRAALPHPNGGEHDVAQGHWPRAATLPRVIDPAMGGGAFLLEALRWVCGPCEPAPGPRQEHATAFAERGLCGVDCSRLAVAVAQAALWLEVAVPGVPAPELLPNLRHGDALLGRGPHPPAARPDPGPDPAPPPPSQGDELEGGAPARIPHQQRRSAADPGASAVSPSPLWCSHWLGQSRAQTGSAPSSCTRLDDLGDALDGGFGPAPPLDWPATFDRVLGGPRGNCAGFDAVLGNPPWEILKPRAPDFFERYAPELRTQLRPAAERSRRALLRDPRLAAAWARYRAGRKRLCAELRASGRYVLQGRGDPATYKLFLELALQLTRPGGRVGLVLPDALLRDLGAADLRRELLAGAGRTDTRGHALRPPPASAGRWRVRSLHVFDNRHLFPIHRSWRVLLLLAQRAGAERSSPDEGGPEIELAFGLSDPAWLDAGPLRSPAPLRLSAADLRVLAPDTLALPRVSDARDLEELAALHAQGVPFGAPQDDWPGLRFARELDLTKDADLFRRRSARRIGLWEGKRIHQYRLDLARPRYWLDSAAAASRVTPRGNHELLRLAYRAVARSTDSWTGIATLLPAGAPAGNSLHVLRAAGVSTTQQLWGLAWLNSFVVNDVLRRIVGANLSMYHVAGLPMVPPARAPAKLRADILDATAHLVLRSCRDERLQAAVAPALARDTASAAGASAALRWRARVEAGVASVMGLDGTRLRTLLERFPLVDSALREETHRRLVALLDSRRHDR